MAFLVGNNTFLFLSGQTEGKVNFRLDKTHGKGCIGFIREINVISC